MEKILNSNEPIIIKNEQIIANILHDIKSPLYSIKIGLQNNLTSELNKEIFKTTINTIEYIENFLTQYNLKEGSFSQKTSLCNLADIIFEKIETFKQILNNKNISIDIEYKNSLTHEDFYINQIYIILSSIFSNLISNIANHSKQKERAKILLNKNNENFIICFKNKIDNNIQKGSNLGLKFCHNIMGHAKIDLEIRENEKEFCIKLNIPNLNNSN